MKLKVWLLLFAYVSLTARQSEGRNTSPGESTFAKRSEKAGSVHEVKRAMKCGLGMNVTCKTSAAQARTFLQDYDLKAEQVRNQLSEADFTHKTNLTKYNEGLLIEAELTKAKFDSEQRVLALEFDVTNMTNDIKRQFLFIKNIGPSAEQNQTKLERLKEVQNQMETIYNTGKVCLNISNCLEFSPGLAQLFATSSDYNLLLRAWKGWRDATGAKMKDMYAEYVRLLNCAVKPSGYQDAGDYWRSWYESATFEPDLAELFAQVKPLYEQLHAHVRRHLKKKYGADKFPSTGHIPAHILGNMWGQAWHNLIDLVLPYPGKPKLDVTAELKRQNYTAKRMFQSAEEFFTSLGLPPMPETFWNKSMLEKPRDGRDVQCHPYALDFYNKKDFRIKMCTDITQYNLMIIHHEMGHIHYYMQYRDQPVIFKQEPNPAFGEAAGDVVALFFQTPEHLNKLGLLAQMAPNDTETDINFLMAMALHTLPLLPFGYLVDQWRWSVFRGDTKPDKYNKYWWDLRCRLHGLSPPVARTGSDFDPGAKFHVPGNVPYIRYFVGYVIQFQFYRGLCDAAGHKGPLHKCDIYNNRQAGQRFAAMMKLGASKPWPDAMEVMTGQKKMNASALLEYFQPLMTYLKGKNGADVGWRPECPTPGAS